MPANLNALIRYKTIDRCLGRKYAHYTIEQLQDVCSEALGEFCGIYKKISERTIRDDIRVMRSDILGFNAPIICEGGYYRYADPGFSIFSAPIKELTLMKQVMKILLENRDRLKENGVDNIIRRLGALIEETSFSDYSLLPIAKSETSHYLPYGDKEEELFSEKQVNESMAPGAEPGRIRKIMKRIKRRKKTKEDFKGTMFLPSLETDTIHFSRSIEMTQLAWEDVLRLVG